MNAGRSFLAVLTTLASAGCLSSVPTGVEVDAGTVVCAYGEPPLCACDATNCGANERCDGVTGRCVPKSEPGIDAGVECSAGARRCLPAAAAVEGVQECRSGAWVNVQACALGSWCALGPDGYFCAACRAGERRCGDGAVETCNERGDAWLTTSCGTDPAGKPVPCVDGRCAVCSSGAQRCDKSGKGLETCSADGTKWDAVFCVITGKCEAAATGARCVPPICAPSETKCVDAYRVGRCRADGLGFDEQDCRTLDKYATAAAFCQANACQDPCAQAAR